MFGEYIDRLFKTSRSEFDPLTMSNWKHRRNKLCWQCNKRSYKIGCPCQFYIMQEYCAKWDVTPRTMSTKSHLCLRKSWKSQHSGTLCCSCRTPWHTGHLRKIMKWHTWKRNTENSAVTTDNLIIINVYNALCVQLKVCVSWHFKRRILRCRQPVSFAVTYSSQHNTTQKELCTHSQRTLWLRPC